MPQALETIRSVVIQIIYVVQFLAGFSIFAGIVILASSIAGTRYRRIREVVVLKTLGATRARIATIFSIEFAVLGLVAGFVGIFFANLVVRVLLLRLTIPNADPMELESRRPARHGRPHRRHRLDRQPPHPRPEAARSAARRVEADVV